MQKHVSYIKSWQWTAPGCEAIGDFLRVRILDAGVWKNLGDTIWKTRNKEVEILELPTDLGGYRVAVKNYHEHRFWRYCLRPSLALRESRGYGVIEKLGIPCAKVIMYGEVRCAVLLKQAYFVTKFEEGTSSLFDFSAYGEKKSDYDNMMTLLRENIKYIAMLHKAGYFHGGAHPRNILWKNNPATGKPESVWIDVATVNKFTFLGKRKRILTDLTDFLERFDLKPADLDELEKLYRSIHEYPVNFVRRQIKSYKFVVVE